MIDPEAIARELVAKLAAHDFVGATSRFDKRMLAGLPKDKLEATWMQVEQTAGRVGEIESVETKQQSGFQVVALTTHFAHARLRVQISVDHDGHIGSLLMRPAEEVSVWQPPAYVRLDAIEDKNVMVGTAPALPGTLSLPRGPGPFAAIVLVHGSGPNDADETIGSIKVFKDLALGLASRGVAVLRYEKRTHADPTGVRTQQEEVDDAAHTAVALLKSTPGIDAQRIVLLGHSQGGYLAPRIAKADPAIRGLIILAGPTRSMQDSIVSQSKYLASLSPANDKANAFIAAAERFKKDVENPALRPDDAVTLPIGAIKLPGAYFLEVRDYHPEKVAASLSIPIAVLQGERDYQVTLADDFAGWKAALHSHKNVSFYTYPAANHTFVAGTGVPTPAEYAKPGHVEQKLIDDLAAWIAALPK